EGSMGNTLNRQTAVFAIARAAVARCRVIDAPRRANPHTAAASKATRASSPRHRVSAPAVVSKATAMRAASSRHATAIQRNGAGGDDRLARTQWTGGRCQDSYWQRRIPCDSVGRHMLSAVLDAQQ